MGAMDDKPNNATPPSPASLLLQNQFCFSLYATTLAMQKPGRRPGRADGAGLAGEPGVRRVIKSACN